MSVDEQQASNIRVEGFARLPQKYRDQQEQQAQANMRAAGRVSNPVDAQKIIGEARTRLAELQAAQRASDPTK